GRSRPRPIEFLSEFAAWGQYSGSRRTRGRGNMGTVAPGPDWEKDDAMYKQILVPIDLTDVELAKPAIETAAMMAEQSSGTVRLINVLPLTPVMLAEYVPPDFETQQRTAAEDALSIIVKESGFEPARISA